MRRRIIKIETREHLISTLAEASELEHSLMCMYLYAVFSLKTDEGLGLSTAELEAVRRWKKQIMEVCIQEMGHLALVCNMTTAVGGTARLSRARFPVQSGLFPQDFVLELARFDLDTLEHFIFLERPDDLDIEDSQEFTPQETVVRTTRRNRLMANIGDYSTVGELYQAVSEGIAFLSNKLGEDILFCGHPSLQLGPKDVELKGLRVIRSQRDAAQAVQLIVEQGEGSRSPKDSHFEKFNQIKDEYLKLLSANPAFEPSLPVARNPVMSSPTVKNTVWISAPEAAKTLDLANAVYTLMLRLLLQIYSMENRVTKAKTVLVNSAFELMHILGAVSKELAKMPATSSRTDIHAGVSFDLDRHLSPLELSGEKTILLERLAEVTAVSKEMEGPGFATAVRGLEKIKASLSAVELAE